MEDSILLNKEQLACLASPARNEAFVALRALGQASVRDLADRLGRSPESLHYHVKALLEANLIHEVFKRPTARKPEAVYESVGKNYRLPNLKSQPSLAPLVRKTVKAGLRHTARGYEQAALGLEKDDEKSPFLHVIRATFKLSEEDAWEFLGKVEAIAKFIEERRTDEGVQLHWSSIAYPDVK